MTNEQNLVPFQFQKNSERTARITQNGGKKSGKVRRQKKTMKELAEKMANMKLTEGKIKEFVKELFPNLNAAELTNQAAIIARQFDRAIKIGDTRACEFLENLISPKGKKVEFPTDFEKIEIIFKGEKA